MNNTIIVNLIIQFFIVLCLKQKLKTIIRVKIQYCLTPTCELLCYRSPKLSRQQSCMADFWSPNICITSSLKVSITQSWRRDMLLIVLLEFKIS